MGSWLESVLNYSMKVFFFPPLTPDVCPHLIRVGIKVDEPVDEQQNAFVCHELSEVQTRRHKL